MDKELKPEGHDAAQLKTLERVYPNAHPLVRFLFNQMRSQQVSVTHMCTASGVHYNTVTHWRKNRAVPNVANLEACMNVLGYTILEPKKMPNVGQ